MNVVLLIAAVVIVVQMAAVLYRVATGPTVFDRVIAVAVIGTNGILVLCLLGFLYGRIQMFVDLAIGYALLNFIAAIALAKYLEHREEKKVG